MLSCDYGCRKAGSMSGFYETRSRSLQLPERGSRDARHLAMVPVVSVGCLHPLVGGFYL